MSFETIFAISITILSIVLAPVLYIWKSVMSRLDELERRQHNKMDHKEVRLLIEDKINPLHEDLQEIKKSLDRIVDKLIDKK